MQVDADLWVGALDLAARHGWRPRGLARQDATPVQGGDRLRYWEGWGQRILAEDAADLARSLAAALPTIPDKTVPMQGKDFGESTTRELIERAAQGQEIPPTDLPGAAEVLSGAPKRDAKVLAEFLSRGPVTVHAG